MPKVSDVAGISENNPIVISVMTRAELTWQGPSRFDGEVSTRSALLSTPGDFGELVTFSLGTGNQGVGMVATANFEYDLDAGLADV